MTDDPFVLPESLDPQDEEANEMVYYPLPESLDNMSDETIMDMIRSYRSLGKFNSLLDEMVYEYSLDSFETAGDTDWHGHYAVVKGLDKDARFARIQRLENETLHGTSDHEGQVYGAIVTVSPTGFVTVDYYTNYLQMTRDFLKIENEYAEYMGEDY